MKIGGFTFLMTEACNFACGYCYQKRGNREIDFSTIEKAVDLFLPLLRKEGYVNFYGGEPLLAFSKIRRTVDLIRKKSRDGQKITCSLSTNGSLLDEEILIFFEKNRFQVLISFDGFAQDATRQNGSFDPLVTVIKRMGAFPQIRFRTHSVFTAETVGQLAVSLEFIMGLGVADIGFALTALPAWDVKSLSLLKKQLRLLANLIKETYRRVERIPIVAFRDPPQRIVHGCTAGLDRLALAPDGTLWGCHVMADCFRREKGAPMRDRFCLGVLDEVTAKGLLPNRNVIGNDLIPRRHGYRSGIRTCLRCPDLYACRVCPADAAVATGRLGEIPSWVCEIQRCIGKEREHFWNTLKR